MSAVTLLPNFATKQECDEMNAWVLQATEKGWMGPGIRMFTQCGLTDEPVRYTTRLYGQPFDRYCDAAYAVQARIIKLFKLSSYQLSDIGAKDGIIVNHMLPTSSIHVHCDKMEGPNKELYALRCSVLSSVADSGGVLNVAGEDVHVGQGDLHCYVASVHKHKVSEIQGTSPRIIWMFGWSIPKDRIENWSNA